MGLSQTSPIPRSPDGDKKWWRSNQVTMRRSQVVMLPPTIEKPAIKVAMLLSTITRTRRLQPIFYDAGPHFPFFVSLFFQYSFFSITAMNVNTCLKKHKQQILSRISEKCSGVV